MHRSVPINSIIVNRANRQRRELHDIPELAQSIAARGLIHSPVINQNHELIVGERRLEACRSLGWTHIEVKFIEELDPAELHAIELEENIKRVDLTWEDRTAAVEAYHNLCVKADPTWTQAKTAERIGVTPGSVAQNLIVAKELKTNPKIAAVAKSGATFSKVLNTIQRDRDRAVAADQIKLDELISGPTEESIINADFHSWVESYTGPKFNFIHCDFPYGINADKHVQGAAQTHGGYTDDEETYFRLLSTLARAIPRICSPSCHIMFWFSMHHYSSTLDYLRRNTPFHIDPFPLIWGKSDNTGIIPDIKHDPRRIYETAFYGYSDDRPVVQSVANAVWLPTENTEHMSAKPVPMLQHFFRMFVDQHTIMLDPTCGGGSAIRAAELAGAKLVIGVEQNPEFAERAKIALANQRLNGRK